MGFGHKNRVSGRFGYRWCGFRVFAGIYPKIFGYPNLHGYPILSRNLHICGYPNLDGYPNLYEYPHFFRVPARFTCSIIFFYGYPIAFFPAVPQFSSEYQKVELYVYYMIKKYLSCPSHMGFLFMQ